MIADVENPAEAVYLDGKKLDLHLVTMADDERGIVEQFVLVPAAGRGGKDFKRNSMGQPELVILRGDVRIIMAPMVRRLH